MGDLRWYKRDPDAALVGMAELTLEERGAYNAILDLIYSREGNLHDDDHAIARWIRCDVRVWRRIRQRLIDLGKLYVHGGNLHNARCDREIYAAQHRLNFRAMLGVKSKKMATKTMLKSTTPTTRKKEYFYGVCGEKRKKEANRGKEGNGTEQKLEPTIELTENIRRKDRRK